MFKRFIVRALLTIIIGSLLIFIGTEARAEGIATLGFIVFIAGGIWTFVGLFK